MKHDVRARRSGDTWDFATREGRGDQWQALARPTLEEWLRLLDGVRRRVGRQRAQRAEEQQLVRMIRAQFPGADVP